MKMKLVEMETKDALEFDSEAMEMIKGIDWKSDYMMSYVIPRLPKSLDQRTIVNALGNIPDGNKIVFPRKLNLKDFDVMEKIFRLAELEYKSYHSVFLTNDGLSIKFDYTDGIFIMKFSSAFESLFPKNLEVEEIKFKGKGVGLPIKTLTDEAKLWRNKGRDEFIRIAGYGHVDGEFQEYKLFRTRGFNLFIPLLHPENHEIAAELPKLPNNYERLVSNEGGRMFDIAAVFARYYKNAFGIKTTSILESVA